MAARPLPKPSILQAPTRASGVCALVDLLPGGSIARVALFEPAAARPIVDHAPSPDLPTAPPPIPAPLPVSIPIPAPPPPAPLQVRPDLLQAIANQRGFGFPGIDARPPAALSEPLQQAFTEARPDAVTDETDLLRLVREEAILVAQILADGLELWLRFVTQYRRELKTQPPPESELRPISLRCRDLLEECHLAEDDRILVAINSGVPRGVRARLCRWVRNQQDAPAPQRAAAQALEPIRARIVLRNLRMAARTSKTAYSSGLSWGERYLAAVTGLIRALDTWEPEGAGSYQTYARHWQKARVGKLALKYGHPACRPSWLNEQAINVQRALDQGIIEKKPERCDVAFVREVASTAVADPNAVERTLLPWWVVEEDVERMADLLAPVELTPAERTHAAKQWMRLDVAMDHLGREHNGKRQRHVMEERLGLNGARQRTLADIGKEIGLSRERVRQIEREAIVGLRKTLGLPLNYSPDGSTRPTSSGSPSSSS